MKTCESLRTCGVELVRPLSLALTNLTGCLEPYLAPFSADSSRWELSSLLEPDFLLASSPLELLDDAVDISKGLCKLR